MTFVDLLSRKMNNSLVFNFNTDVSETPIPNRLNNPFGLEIPEIGRIAANEFQKFIELESKNWEYDFSTQKGKMFGVLVVQKIDGGLGYLGTMSGVFPGGKTCKRFVPSVFDESKTDFYLTKGMTELTEIGKTIKNSTDPKEITKLTELRKQKSHDLQQWLFEHYIFTNKYGKAKNVATIFAGSEYGNPPAATGECAAPKLIQYAFSNNLKPIALAEFWWGIPSKSNKRKHLGFYPACEDKCRGVLGFMLKN